MFRLIHLSDVHLGPLPRVRRRDLVSKRITGYVNWHRNRRDAMGGETLEKLITHVQAARPDHIVITGDLVNLALDAEISIMADWLSSVGAPRSVTVVPGNHDTYVPGALAAIKKAWRPFMSGDGADQVAFPFIRLRGDAAGETPIAIVGTNSGRATAPFLATGSFRDKQANMLRDHLRSLALEKRFRVVLIHHPPFKGATSWNKRLIGSSRFRGVIEDAGAELVLHGHTHIESDEIIPGPYQAVRVIGVPSASHDSSALAPSTAVGPGPAKSKSGGYGKPGAQYNLFDISQPSADGGWRVRWRQHGYGDGSHTVQELKRSDFTVPSAVPVRNPRGST